MHKSIPMIFAILVLFVFILFSACVTQPITNQSYGQSSGITQITLKADSSRISFEDARQTLREYGSGLSNQSVNVKTVYYMLSRDVDGSGNATSWIFGISHQRGTEFLVYDNTGWETIPWNATPNSEPIDLDTIVSPDRLLIENKAVISGNSSSLILPERMDLELQRGVYTLTITSSDSNRNLKFNATTGVLIG
jgi:hypothetical protein